MGKNFIFGLVILLGISNTASAAITSLSTTGAWTTANGTLSGLLGQSAPATWTYDTDLSLATPYTTPSGASAAFLIFNGPTYGLSGTTAPGILDGNSFNAYFIDNFLVATDFGLGNTLSDAMLANGLDPTETYDWLSFNTSKVVNGVNYRLSGSMFFDDDFITGPITTFPTAETLMANFLLLTAELGADTGQPGTTPGSIVLDGYASYAQVGPGPSAVPVPAAAFMFTPALLGLLGWRRKTKNLFV